MARSEIKSAESLRQLNQQLADAIRSGAESGDLSLAQNFKNTIEIELAKIRAQREAGLFCPSYPVLVNYEKSIAELIKRGNFKFTDYQISDSNFPSSKSDQQLVRIHLFRFEHLNTETVIQKMTNLDFRPASLKELLSLAIQIPNVPLPIVALDKPCFLPGMGNCIPMFCDRGGGRYGRSLRLVYYNSNWSLGSYFAAVNQ